MLHFCVDACLVCAVLGTVFDLIFRMFLWHLLMDICNVCVVAVVTVHIRISLVSENTHFQSDLSGQVTLLTTLVFYHVLLNE